MTSAPYQPVHSIQGLQTWLDKRILRAKSHKLPSAKGYRVLLATFGLFFATVAHTQTGTETKIQVIFVEDVVVNSIPVQGRELRINEPVLRSELAQEFNQSVVRAIVKSGIAVAAKPLFDRLQGADGYVLRTVLDMPLTHEVSKTHQSNRYRTGTFMKYRLMLVSNDGRIVAASQGGLTWGDGDWSRLRTRSKSHRSPARIARPHNEVMKGYVRKAIYRGINDLKLTLKTPQVGSRSPFDFRSISLANKDDQP